MSYSPIRVGMNHTGMLMPGIASCFTRISYNPKLWMTSFRDGIRAIEADRVVGAHELRLGTAELAVRAGILDVPCELLGDHANDGRLVLGRKLFHSLRPRRNRVEDEQHHLGDDDADFQAFRDLAFRAFVTGFRIRAAAVPEHHVDEERAPADEQHGHQPMHQDSHLIDLGGVRRRLNGHVTQH